MIHWVSLQSILVIIVPSVLTGEGSNRSLTENQNTQIYLSKSPDVVFGQVEDLPWEEATKWNQIHFDPWALQIWFEWLPADVRYPNINYWPCGTWEASKRMKGCCCPSTSWAPCAFHMGGQGCCGGWKLTFFYKWERKLSLWQKKGAYLFGAGNG